MQGARATTTTTPTANSQQQLNGSSRSSSNHSSNSRNLFAVAVVVAGRNYNSISKQVQQQLQHKCNKKRELYSNYTILYYTTDGNPQPSNIEKQISFLHTRSYSEVELQQVVEVLKSQAKQVAK